jgi:hypothetical protein
MRFAIFCLFIFACIVWYRIQQPHPAKPIERVTVGDSVARPFVNEEYPDSLQWKTEPRVTKADAQ